MPSAGSPTSLSWARVGDGCLRLIIETSLYPEDVIFRTCYLFTDRCYLFLSKHGKFKIAVDVRPKQDLPDVDAIAGEFGNELINQKVRADLAEETAPLRQLIVTQAFAEADFDGGEDA